MGTTAGESMKEIPLTQKKSALVDDEDYPELSKYRWHVAKQRTGNYYAIRNSPRENGKQQTIRMHRVILGTPTGMDTDHINGNGLDNRRENLRIVTARGNAQNLHIPKTSKYVGVSWDDPNRKWVARIKIREKCRNLGYFDDEKDASAAYARACEFPELVRPLHIKSSKYRGVTWSGIGNKWLSQISIGGKYRYLGLFENELEAATVYNVARKILIDARGTVPA